METNDEETDAYVFALEDAAQTAHAAEVEDNHECDETCDHGDDNDAEPFAWDRVMWR